jgi:hypothetical protein
LLLRGGRKVTAWSQALDLTQWLIFEQHSQQAYGPVAWRDAAAIGLLNLIYNMARYEQIVRLQLLPLRAA